MSAPTSETVGVVTDEIAGQVRDLIATVFDASPGYGPQLMDPGWDEGVGRVIVWEYGPDGWTYAVPFGGALEYGPEVPELCLPAGVWIDRINHHSVRVLPA
ncbi:hypothetical protein ACU635_13950 [[Actinomadura] parvosata]|uniref:hypothetical protein n=1 Tax=[Actinomadura] parvosata TaxID=1955412 RepID=UPI00406BFAF6